MGSPGSVSNPSAVASVPAEMSGSELQAAAMDPRKIGQRYFGFLDRHWDKLPAFVAKFLVSFAIIMFGFSIHGDWMLLVVHFFKYMNGDGDLGATADVTISEQINGSSASSSPFSLKDYRLEGLGSFLFPATLMSYVSYFGAGGFLHWFYYVRQRDRPQDWKCQPTKWLAPELELHEIVLGSTSLFLGSIISGVFSCYINNGGWTTLYYNVSDYGWVWLFLQFPIVFIWQDYLTYWHHRLYHNPFLYKHFHKLHHTYKQPTAFSVTAIHPVEFLHIQAVLMSNMFLFPTHYMTQTLILPYVYCNGILNHSGINFKAQWWQPWQPHCIFHDNHHQYFHVNFGFNIEYWDKLHGTYRMKDRIYREDIFYGKGKSLKEASETELAKDIAERKSENPLAHDNDKNTFELFENDLKLE